MKTATDILSYAIDHDIHLSFKGGKLKMDAPEGELTDRFLNLAKKYKYEIIGIIMARDCGAAKQINIACRGLSITPSQFASLCSAEDLQLIGEGKFSPECLRGYGVSYNEGIQSGRIKVLSND